MSGSNQGRRQALRHYIIYKDGNDILTRATEFHSAMERNKQLALDVSQLTNEEAMAVSVHGGIQIETPVMIEHDDTGNYPDGLTKNEFPLYHGLTR